MLQSIARWASQEEVIVDWKQYVSVAALVVSVISFGLTHRLSAQTATMSVRPVLVFEYSEGMGWSIRNVGNGPALNVVVAERTQTPPWLKPVRIPPLPKDGTLQLGWIGHRNVRTLGATYVDISNRSYSSTCTDDLSLTEEGNVLGSWRDHEISRHWQLPRAEAR
jgi:hypothetical protein